MNVAKAPAGVRPSTRSIRGPVLATLVCAIGLGMASPASSIEQAPVYGYALAHELMSPFCPGRTLAACTSEQAAEMRQWILLQEAAGASREEVIAVLESKYGDQIRSSPEADGWGLAAWLLPGLAVAIGAVLAIFSLRRLVGTPRNGAVGAQTSRPERAQKSASAVDDALLEQLIDAEFAETRR